MPLWRTEECGPLINLEQAYSAAAANILNKKHFNLESVLWDKAYIYANIC